MAVAAPIVLAGWTLGAGFTGQDAVRATTIALANGANPGRPSGLWGVGGPTNDGPGQAAAAYAAFRDQGWAAFTGKYDGGRAALYLPIATAAVPAAEAAHVARQVPIVEDVSNAGKALGGGNPGEPAVSNGNPLFTALATPITVLNFFTQPNAWNRIAKVTIGMILITIGSASLTNRTVLQPLLRGLGIVDEKIAQQAALSAT